jgi:hypothetical protein
MTMMTDKLLVLNNVTDFLKMTAASSMPNLSTEREAEPLIEYLFSIQPCHMVES